MLFIFTLVLSWLVWLLFADKRRWRELFTVSLLAVALGLFTDASMHHYRLWKYHDLLLSEHLIELTFQSGIYTVVAYLSVQWLPQPPTPLRLFRYWLGWTTLTISIEILYVATGHMTYQKWWSIGHSYLADWSIFWLLYKFHRLFRLERLSASWPPRR